MMRRMHLGNNLEVFTVFHVNPLHSTGFLWTPVDSKSNLFVWYSIQFWELDWTRVLSESTGIPVLLESCGLESTGLKGTPEESTGLDRTQGESTGLQETQGESTGLPNNS